MVGSCEYTRPLTVFLRCVIFFSCIGTQFGIVCHQCSCCDFAAGIHFQFFLLHLAIQPVIEGIASQAEAVLDQPRWRTQAL